MLEDLSASLGSYSRFVASLIHLNVTLYSRNVGTTESDTAPAATMAVDDLSLPPEASAVLRVFAWEALLGPGAPKLLSETGSKLVAGDPDAIASRWKGWLREKRPLSAKEIADRHFLKVSEHGRALICKAGPGASLLEWEAFGERSDGWNGDWSVTPKDGLLRISIGSGAYNLYVVGSREGVHYGFEAETDSLFVIGLPRRRSRRAFLKVTDWNQVRLVAVNRRGQASEGEPFRRDARWPANWKRSGGTLTLSSHSEGYEYVGTFGAADDTGLLWGTEHGSPLEPGGEQRSSRLLMLGI